MSSQMKEPIMPYHIHISIFWFFSFLQRQHSVKSIILIAHKKESNLMKISL